MEAAAVDSEGLVIPTAGFIYLKGLPITAQFRKHVFETSVKYFKLPTETKMSHGWTTPEANRGYSALGREKTTKLADIEEVKKLRDAVPDLKESFEIGREGVEGHPNHWPEETGELVGFKETMMEFHTKCKELHMEVMRAIAVGLGIDEFWFDDFTDEGDNTLRLLHYPEVNKDVFKVNPGQVRAGAHSDYGSITLLFQDSSYFCNPNFKSYIAAIPGTYVNEKDLKYEGINSGQYLVQRLTATY
ncbi:hypothetical protein DL764_008027 [Monosporascus ibericus]|uniref:Non-haem dioxygenase N-terminal domain-containing protein n=1 Tax=Monosporascus ibericus TaxID=155417 RepID=A0A4Q4SYJ7_9PEZI|nr:hypothetical protein DL764_008027 [Monosporascus ibericus]